MPPLLQAPLIPLHLTWNRTNGRPVDRAKKWPATVPYSILWVAGPSLSAGGTGHCAAGHRRRLAPARVSHLLALEVAQPRPAARRAPPASPHPPHVARRSVVWRAPRLQAELRLLGHDLAESTVALYIDRRGKPPSPAWRTFLANHLTETAAVDFFVVPTATFRLLYCFLILSPTAAGCCTSTSRPIPVPAGPPSRSSRRFPSIVRHGFCSVIVTRFTATSSGVGSRDWASKRSLLRLGRRGRTPMRNASLARCGANAWITWWYSTRLT